VECRVGYFLPDRIECGGVGAGDEQVVAGGDDALGDGGYLFRRFSGAENDFGKALPDAAVMVDPGEAEVLERRLAQNL
jgi:hypothetical protein